MGHFLNAQQRLVEEFERAGGGSVLVGSRKVTRHRSMTCSARTVQKRFRHILLQRLGSDDWDVGSGPICLPAPKIAKCPTFPPNRLQWASWCFMVSPLSIPNSYCTWFWGRNATAFVGISLMWPALLTSTPSLGRKMTLFLGIWRKKVDREIVANFEQPLE